MAAASPQPIPALTLIIADDHDLMRETLAAFCAAIDLRVVGQAADGQTAVELVLQLKPDFAILDLDMPRLSGTQAVRKIRETQSKTKLLILTLTNDGRAVREAFHAGADGFLLKSGSIRQLEDAVKEAQEGAIYVAPELRRAAMRADDSSPVLERPDPLEPLSDREREVFYHLVREKRIKDIAETLELSPKTVDTYKKNLMKKLGVDSIGALVRFAIRHKLIDP